METADTGSTETEVTDTGTTDVTNTTETVATDTVATDDVTGLFADDVQTGTTETGNDATETTESYLDGRFKSREDFEK